MRKVIITGIIGSIGMIGGVFAHDCALVVDKNLKEVVNNYTINYKAYTENLTTEAFNQALINLKAYCCSQVVNPPCESDEKKNLPNKYPESAYLYDHLIDISMRRLDGITGLAYGLAPDTTALERRAKINTIANTALGVPASEIEKVYTKYRSLADTTSLAYKYNTLCQELKDLHDSIKGKDKIIIGGYVDKSSFFNKCRKLVKERVERENGYVKILMVQKSNQMLNESMTAYTKKHFVEEKLMALWTLIGKVKDMFKTIVQQAPASKSCSK